MSFGQQALKLVILKLLLPKPFGLSGVHAAVLGSPFVKAGVAKAVFAANLFDRHTSLGLPQKANDLLFAEFAWFACPSFS